MTEPSHVAVVVRLRGILVEERLLRLAGEVWLGDAPEAQVSFPGAAVVIRRDLHGRWMVGAHPLMSHRPVVLRFGPVELACEGVAENPSPRPLEGLPHLTPAIVTLAALLLGGFVDAGARVLDRNPEIAAHLEALVLGSPGSEAPPPGVHTAPEPDPWPPTVELLEPPLP